MDFAKIHFGSFTTPQNTFTTTDDPQPPLPSNPEPQDSPQPDTIDPDQEAEQEDSEDVERVEELVGSADAEGQLSLDTDIPFSADYVDDGASEKFRVSCSFNDLLPQSQRLLWLLGYREPWITRLRRQVLFQTNLNRTRYLPSSQKQMRMITFRTYLRRIPQLHLKYPQRLQAQPLHRPPIRIWTLRIPFQAILCRNKT